MKITMTLSRKAITFRKSQPTAVVAQRVHRDRKTYSRKVRNGRGEVAGW